MIDPDRLDAGVPPGTAALAVRFAEQAAATATALTGRRHVVDEAAVLGHLLLPLIVGDTPQPAPPRPAPGGGWVHADLLPEDEELLALLSADRPDAERWAAVAQECRLPVTPYRTRSRSRTAAALAVAGCTNAPPGHRTDPGRVRVLDLTTMWAGPLATMQLAAWGAEVTTVEPLARPDGLRRSPAQFAVLDTGKRRVPWDLRIDGDRAAFEDAVRHADVVIESFSGRVMANFGYGGQVLRALNPRVSVVSIRAFPAGRAERSWVAYGRGVHAASGLGMVAGRPQPALLAYPDVLAGLSAFAAVLAALGASGRRAVEVSLAGAMGPLVETAGGPGEIDEEAIAVVRDATAARPGAAIRPV